RAAWDALRRMARPRPEKKRQKAKPVQPPLPGMPSPAPPGTARVLPMQLQIGDRMTDSTGEWQVVGRPYTTNGGENAHVRVQQAEVWVIQPGQGAASTGGQRAGIQRHQYAEAVTQHVCLPVDPRGLKGK